MSREYGDGRAGARRSPGVPPGMVAVQRDIAADGDVELVKALEHAASLAATRRQPPVAQPDRSTR
jgi:hypothetical protein